MSDQTIHSPAEAKGKPILVGDRGGLKTKDEFKGRTINVSSAPKPTAVCKGPGYDIGFFKEKDGFRIYYRGPNAEAVIEQIKRYVHDGIPIEEAVQKVHMED